MFSEEPQVTEEVKSDELRSVLLKLAEDGGIKYTTKYIKKASEKTLESIYKEYERQQLDETNDQLADILITKFSELMKALEAVEDKEGMEKELCENKLLKKDLKRIVGYVTPYIPLVGILSGGVTVGKHVLSSKIVEKE